MPERRRNCSFAPLASRHGLGHLLGEDMRDGCGDIVRCNYPRMVKDSELQRLGRELQGQLAQLPRVDPMTLSLAAESLRASSGLHPNLIPSVTKVFDEIDLAAFPKASAFRDAARAINGPIVAPQIAAALAPFTPDTRSFLAEANSVLTKSTVFKFSKTLDDVGSAWFFEENRVGLSLQALRAPSLAASVTAAMRTVPRVEVSDLAHATEDAIALAETEDVVAVDDESAELTKGLSPAQRRDLAVDVALLIGAYISIVACLAKRDYIDLAAALLVYSAVLVRIYWRLMGKLG